MVWEIMAIENCGLPSGPRMIAVSWNSYLLVGLLTMVERSPRLSTRRMASHIGDVSHTLVLRALREED